MIIVTGEARFAAGELDRLRGLLESTVAATREEAGCELYSYAIDIGDPNLLRISERWTDEAAIDAHFRTPHLAELSAALGAAKLERISVKAYSAEYLSTLMGD